MVGLQNGIIAFVRGDALLSSPAVSLLTWSTLLWSVRNELVAIDSWLAPDGKHGLRRDWLVHDHNTGEVLARATR